MSKITEAKLTEHLYIVRMPGVCGGEPVIKETRFPVRSIVGYIGMGMTPEEIVKDFPQLNLSQVHDALSYYYDHQEEIDRDIQLNNDTEHWQRLYPPGQHKSK